MIENELNPVIFDSTDTMRSEVRESLLDISDLFLTQIKEDSQLDMSPLDIVLVGSNASYNYTDKSDIDLHIVVNFDTLPACPTELIQAFCNAEKISFNKDYDFTIHDSSVEVYVEDVKTSSISNGIYSILLNEWVRVPKLPESSETDDTVCQSEEYSTMYNEAVEALSSNNLDQIRNIIDELYLFRKNSLSVDGELGLGNLIFKELRRQGVLDDLKDKYKDLVSDEYSLEHLSTSKLSNLL